MPDSTTHFCAARACKTKVPLRMLMCSHHWRMVPRALQVRVWDEYKPGQEQNLGRVSPEYLAVVEEAVQAVANVEGRRPAVKRRDNE